MFLYALECWSFILVQTKSQVRKIAPYLPSCLFKCVRLCILLNNVLKRNKDRSTLSLPIKTQIYFLYLRYVSGRGRRDRTLGRFTTTYAISAYHHWCCEFEFRSGRGVQHNVIKFVSDLRQVVVFTGSSGFLHQ
jgi:hypothetical protein